MSIAEGVDRRRFARQRVRSLSYVELGKDNGGIVLNVSEGGLAVAAATPMMGESLPRVRFRLPGSSVWIESCARIAWIAESRKEAGILFLDLPEVDRTRIRLWLLSPEPVASAPPPRAAAPGPRLVPPPPKVAPQVSRLRPEDETQLEAELEADPDADDADFQPETKVASPPVQQVSPEITPAVAKTAASESASSESPGSESVNAKSVVADGISPEILAAIPDQKIASHRPLVPSFLGSPQADHEGASPEEPVAAEERAAERRPAAEHWVRPQPGPGRWVLVSALVFTIAALAFLLGISVGRRSWDSLLARFGNVGTSIGSLNGSARSGNPPQSAAASAPAASQGPITSTAPEGSPSSNFGTQSAEPVAPSASSQWAPASPGSQAGDEAVQPSGGFARAPVARPTPPADTVPPVSSLAAPRESAPQSSAAVQPRAVEPATPAPSSPHAAEPASPATVRQPSAPLYTPALSPPIRSFDQAPALEVAPAAAPSAAPSGNLERAGVAPSVPAAIPTGSVEVVAPPYPSIRVPPALRPSRSGTPLQLGQLTLRVEPVYPQQALREGVQGIVQLHVLIGADGSVTDMEVVRGPQLLIPAARDAVGRWHYQPTYLGTQAVETEADVTINFRLTLPPSAATPASNVASGK